MWGTWFLLLLLERTVTAAPHRPNSAEVLTSSGEVLTPSCPDCLDAHRLSDCRWETSDQCTHEEVCSLSYENGRWKSGCISHRDCEGQPLEEPPNPGLHRRVQHHSSHHLPVCGHVKDVPNHACKICCGTESCIHSLRQKVGNHAITSTMVATTGISIVPNLCKDVNEGHCTHYKDRLCSGDPAVEHIAVTECPKTCNRCTANLCKDVDEGNCIHYKDIFCSGDPSVEHIAVTECPKTCNRCTVSNMVTTTGISILPNLCKDLDEGHCTHYKNTFCSGAPSVEHIAVNECPKTCNRCTLYTASLSTKETSTTQPTSFQTSMPASVMSSSNAYIGSVPTATIVSIKSQVSRSTLQPNNLASPSLTTITIFPVPTAESTTTSIPASTATTYAMTSLPVSTLATSTSLPPSSTEVGSSTMHSKVVTSQPPVSVNSSVSGPSTLKSTNGLFILPAWCRDKDDTFCTQYKSYFCSSAQSSWEYGIAVHYCTRTCNKCSEQTAFYLTTATRHVTQSTQVQTSRKTSVTTLTNAYIDSSPQSTVVSTKSQVSFSTSRLNKLTTPSLTTIKIIPGATSESTTASTPSSTAISSPTTRSLPVSTQTTSITPLSTLTTSFPASTTEMGTTTLSKAVLSHQTTGSIPTKGIDCYECDGDNITCEFLYRKTTCNSPNQYCLNKLKNNADGTRILIRRCGTEAECLRDWWHGSSDNQKCRTFDENNVLAYKLDCTYCCTKPFCNMPLIPDTNTLFTV